MGQLGLTISVYGQPSKTDLDNSKRMDLGDPIESKYVAVCKPEFENLEAWRAHLKSKGEHDPLEHLNAADRCAYVDSHRSTNYLQKSGSPYFTEEYGVDHNYYGRGKWVYTVDQQLN